MRKLFYDSFYYQAANVAFAYLVVQSAKIYGGPEVSQTSVIKQPEIRTTYAEYYKFLASHFGELYQDDGVHYKSNVCNTILGMIQTWCEAHNLPRINLLVVNPKTRLPGHFEMTEQEWCEEVDLIYDQGPYKIPSAKKIKECFALYQKLRNDGYTDREAIEFAQELNC